MFDIHQAESEVRSQLESQVREQVLSRLVAAKEQALAKLEEVKADLNAIDSEIAARQPQG